MALKIYDRLEPQGDYPAVIAEDVEMPDGTRLSQWGGNVPPVLPGAAVLEPEKYYQFGDVDALAVTLAVEDDGKAHEYVFEFTPAEGFQGLVIDPVPTWLREPQYPAGKRCVVSIMQGLAVMGNG